jgi:predicted KAP-like P-loop ATPase
MTTARQIAGNPRLIKRFLNTLTIRLSIARQQQVNVDEAALAKMLLFERCGKEAAYAALVKAINDNEEGKPAFLQPLETAATRGEKIEKLPPEWEGDFVKDWLALPPAFADLDLRPVVYVSREHMPIITSADQLSSDAAELLIALLETKQTSPAITVRVKQLPKREISLLMERLIARARQIQEWGVPPILHACLTIIAADQDQAVSFVSFLRQIPRTQLRPAIIPILNDKMWAQEVLKEWREHKDTPSPVRKAIEAQKKEIR